MNHRWDSYFMDVAFRTSMLSYANRLKVGSVAVRDKRIICVGFNGTAPGESNECEADNVTLPSVIHSEDNLVRYATLNNIPLDGCTLYVTHLPCPNCAEIVSKSGISEVVYCHDYRLSTGLEILINNKIKTRKYQYGYQSENSQ